MMGNLQWFSVAGVLMAAMAVGILSGLRISRRTTGPRERAYVRRNCFITSLLIGLFVVAPIAFPKPMNYLIPALLLITVPWLLYRWSLRRQLIRHYEARNRVAEVDVGT